jgi:hypothetical protein
MPRTTRNSAGGHVFDALDCAAARQVLFHELADHDAFLRVLDEASERGRLYVLIDKDADQVLFLPACNKCLATMEAMGRPMAALDVRDVVVVVCGELIPFLPFSQHC